MNIKIILYLNICTFMLYLHQQQQQQHVSHSYARKNIKCLYAVCVCSMLCVYTVTYEFLLLLSAKYSLSVSVCPIAFDGVVHVLTAVTSGAVDVFVVIAATTIHTFVMLLLLPLFESPKQAFIPIFIAHR